MKNTLLVSIFWMLASLYCTANEEQNLRVGLVSELVQIKVRSENILIRVLQDSTVADQDKRKVVSAYIDVKILADQLIMQLISDCRAKNRLGFYKKIDKLFVEKKASAKLEGDFKRKKLQNYQSLINRLLKEFKGLVNILEDTPEPKLFESLGYKGLFSSRPSLEEATGVLSFVSSTIKDARESRQNKVEKVTAILVELRLAPLQDLMKSSESEKDEKDD